MVILVVGTLGYVGYVVIGNIFMQMVLMPYSSNQLVWLLVDFTFNET